MRRTSVRVAVTLFACAAGTIGWTRVADGQRAPSRVEGRAAAPARGDWATYGHDPGGSRFSPLTQITPANAAKLEIAWVYHMKPPAAPPASSGFSSGETTPLVINGVMYVSTPYGRV